MDLLVPAGTSTRLCVALNDPRLFQAVLCISLTSFQISAENMDELTKSLATTWTVSNRPNDTAAQHPRYTLYKVKSNTPDQLERRRRFLDGQKKYSVSMRISTGQGQHFLHGNE
jgi:spermidine/putrescine-binding protein